MNTSTGSNEELVLHLLKGCRKNDRQAQKLLYKHFYSYAMSICIRYSKDREEAVEILNDSFMKVFLNIKKFNPDFPFKAWFRKITVNASIDHIKRNRRIFSESSLHDTQEFEVQESITSGIHYQELIELIHELTPAYRTVFNLHVIEGYKHEEIAEMLGINVGTSKSNLFKAKEKLRGMLQDLFNDDHARREER